MSRSERSSEGLVSGGARRRGRAPRHSLYAVLCSLAMLAVCAVASAGHPGQDKVCLSSAAFPDEMRVCAQDSASVPESSSSGEARDHLLSIFSVSPALFEQNDGQFSDPGVRFVHRGKGANVLLTDSGPVFQLFRSEGEGESATMQAHVFRVCFEGARPVRPVGLGEPKARFNYYVGNDPARWREDVPTYEKVAYRGLYPGVNLVVHGMRSHLKYEFRVAPGADPNVIRIRYEGIEELQVDEAGRLRVRTVLGTLTDDAPYIYQSVGGRRMGVAGHFLLLDKRTYGFAVTGRYDRNAELVIDPDLIWGSFLGGSGHELHVVVAADADGNALLVGITASPDFPVPGGFDTMYNGGDHDVFVAKVTASGELAWASFLGGSSRDYGLGIGVDDAGNVLLEGATYSNDFPTPGGFDTTHNGGGWDTFVAKVTASGQLAWASYLGGSGTDYAYRATVDSTGSMWFVGGTDSSNFPTPAGSTK